MRRRNFRVPILISSSHATERFVSALLLRDMRACVCRTLEEDEKTSVRRSITDETIRPVEFGGAIEGTDSEGEIVLHSVGNAIN